MQTIHHITEAALAETPEEAAAALKKAEESFAAFRDTFVKDHPEHADAFKEGDE